MRAVIGILVVSTATAVADDVPTRAELVSSRGERLIVRVEGESACATPCELLVAPLSRVTLEMPDRRALDVGYLPAGAVRVRADLGTPVGVYAGVAGTTLSAFGLIGGLAMVGVGYAADADEPDVRTIRRAGLITTGASALGMYLSIKLLQWARPKAEVLPAQPYISGNALGLAGSF